MKVSVASNSGRRKVPGWMVSFGDMMTLILTFFILLVSLSREQQVGLIARGIGSFIVNLKTFGLDGMLSSEKKLEVFNEVRVRFSLPPVEDLDALSSADDAWRHEVLRAQDIRDLPPVRELFQPAIAVFSPGSVALDDRARAYIDLLAPSLRPSANQILVLEARPPDESPKARRDAQLRLSAVAEHLTRRHRFVDSRVESRLWLGGSASGPSGSIDARLLTPHDSSQR